MAETEAILLKRFARSGDAAAFAEIIRRHAGLVYSAALRVLADVDRASDVAQETFLQLTKDAANVSGSLPGWLHRVATHKAIDQMRQEAARRQREMKYSAEQPQKAAEWKDISPHVDRALYELDPDLRDVLILHFLQDCSTREIGRRRGISQATVSRRIEAGVAQLRATLRKRGIIVALGALSVLLGNNAIEAAPKVLMMELGKMAMAGGSLAAAVGGVSGAGSASLESVAAGVLAFVKTNAVAVAAAAVIVTGSAVTFRQLAGPSSSGQTPVVVPPTEQAEPIDSAPRPMDEPTAMERRLAPERDVRVKGGSDYLDRRNEHVLRTLAAWKESTLEAEQDPATFVPGGPAPAGQEASVNETAGADANDRHPDAPTPP